MSNDKLLCARSCRILVHKLHVRCSLIGIQSQCSGVKGVGTWTVNATGMSRPNWTRPS